MSQKVCPNLVFKVKIRETEVIRPSKPTPIERKSLSDVDYQQNIRFHLPFILFYPNRENVTRDPVKAIRKALADLLVFYYPFAGRLRELPDGKIIVECSGEGVLFVEADADVRMEDFGPEFCPPFPGTEELIYNVPGSSDSVLHTPLLLIQVTRLQCGGFILGLRVNHHISDTSGTLQFMVALGEITRGMLAPSVLPVWQRELLSARNPPRVTCTHHEFDNVVPIEQINSEFLSALSELDYRSFLFGPNQISVLRNLVPDHLAKSSTFDILTAYLWRCRTIALGLHPHEEVRIMFIIDVRYKSDLKIPNGYSGNAIVFVAAVSTAGKLTKNSIEYALELVNTAKSKVTSEYVRSTTDLLVTMGMHHVRVPGSWVVSDTSRAPFKNVDLGWGNAEYGGFATGLIGRIPGWITPYVRSTNKNNKNIIVVPMCLKSAVMKRFVKEISSMFPENHPYIQTMSKL